MSERLQYLPALDGLRAIAVTSVLLYHLDIGWARGGFLGVDLFFVISGYLITTLLLRERTATGRIGLGSFWVRRFKRLVPPLVVMTAATIAATRLWGLPEQWASIRWDAASALGYVANWRFVIADQSYFDSLLGPSPLRHTWSLAVEEQWYLLWPVVMVGLAALAVWRRRGAVIAACLVVVAALASAIWMAVLYDADDPSRAYYGTDTRAQQLLVGAALAWLIGLRPGLTRFGERTSGAWALMGAVAVYLGVASRTADDAAWLYQGGFLAVSVLCAALVIGTATANVAAPLRWLTWRPLLWVGVRSYGIYLWHWPVIIFVGAPMGLELSRLPLIALQVALTLVLADVSHRYIERPVRNVTRRPLVVVGAWTAAALVATLASFVVLRPASMRNFDDVAFLTPDMFLDAPDPAVSTPAVSTPMVRSSTGPNPESIAESVGRPAPKSDEGSAPVAPQPARLAASETRPPTLLLLGDSTAFRLAVNRQREATREWDLFSYAQPGCGIFDGATVDSDTDRVNDHPTECAGWRDAWRQRVEEIQPHVVAVMVGAWEMLDWRIDDVTYRFPSVEWSDLVRRNLSDAAEVAGSTGAPVVLMTLPCMLDNGDEKTTARNDIARVTAFNQILAEVATTRPWLNIAHLDELLCPGGDPLEDIDGNVVRYDGVHLSEAGTQFVWDWLIPQIDARRR